MNQFLDRVIRAARLDATLYEEVEADPSSMSQAALIVVLANLAAGAGAIVRFGVTGFAVVVLAALLGWVTWALLTYYIGTKILPEPQTEADIGQLMRTLGFASAPGLIRFFGFIPALSGILAVISAAWMLAAMVVAVRQALDYESTGRALGVCSIGFCVQALFIALALQPLTVQ